MGACSKDVIMRVKVINDYKWDVCSGFRAQWNCSCASRCCYSLELGQFVLLSFTLSLFLLYGGDFSFSHSVRKESKEGISIFVVLEWKCLICRHYLWILRLRRGMWCIYGGDLAHFCVGDLEWIHNNISLCSRCLSVSTHHSCPFTNAPSTAGVRSIFGVPRNLWWCKKKKGIWGKKHYLELTFYCKNISSGNVKNMFDVETRTFPSYIKLENII